MEPVLLIGEPVQIYFFRAGQICFLCQHGSKLMLLHGDAELDNLARLYICPGTDNQAGIFG